MAKAHGIGHDQLRHGVCHGLSNGSCDGQPVAKFLIRLRIIANLSASSLFYLGVSSALVVPLRSNFVR